MVPLDRGEGRWVGGVLLYGCEQVARVVAVVLDEMPRTRVVASVRWFVVKPRLYCDATLTVSVGN